jgi:hypothetical protein
VSARYGEGKVIEVRTVSPTQISLATNCWRGVGLAYGLLWGCLEGRTEAGHRRVHRSVANAATSPTG